jgi:phosphopantetheinyl transferase
MSHVIVLHAPLPGHAGAAHESALLARVPYAKRLQLEHRDPASRSASLAGIALALQAVALLRGRGVLAADLRFPQDGKPTLADGPFFSISHSVTRVACAASDELDCGIDIEDAGSASPMPTATRERMRAWTAVEAVLKAAGLGLRAARDVKVAADFCTADLRGAPYWLLELDLGPDTVAHLAAPRAIRSVRIEACPPVPVAPAP